MGKQVFVGANERWYRTGKSAGSHAPGGMSYISMPPPSDRRDRKRVAKASGSGYCTCTTDPRVTAIVVAPGGDSN
jgi:hypothetical protein